MEDRKDVSPENGESRRDIIKKMAYAAPVVLTLAASPSFASHGSGKPCGRHSSSRDLKNNQYVTN